MAMHIIKQRNGNLQVLLAFIFVVPNWIACHAFHHTIVDFLVINEVKPLTLCGFDKSRPSIPKT